MTEAVLVLPVIMLLLGLLLMLGRASTRLQHVSVADRYEAWRSATDAPGPGWAEHGTDDAQINAALLGGAASEFDVTRSDAFPTEPGDMLVQAAEAQSSEAGAFTLAALDRLPNGRRAAVKASFESTIPLESRLGLNERLRASHARLANEWKFANGLRYDEEYARWEPASPRVSMRRAVRDTYLQGLHSQIEPLASGGNAVAQSIEAMYTADPGYDGPYLEVPSP